MGRAKIFITRTTRWAVEIDDVDNYEVCFGDIYDQLRPKLDDMKPCHVRFSSDVVSLEGLGYHFIWDYLPHQEKEGEHKRLLILEAKGVNTRISQKDWDIFVQAIKDSGVNIVDTWNGPLNQHGTVRYSGSDPYISPEQVAQIQKAIEGLQPEISDVGAIDHWQESFEAQKK